MQDRYNGSRLTAQLCAQFVVLGGARGGFIPSARANGALLSSTFKSKFIRQLFRIHTYKRLNRIFSLPFKWIWNKSLFNDESISKDKNVYFILTESFGLAYSRDYLKNLRTKYENCRIIFYFRNPVINHVNLI